MLMLGTSDRLNRSIRFKSSLVGVAVGVGVGDTVGVDVGDSVGLIVGVSEGASVGESVGASVDGVHAGTFDALEYVPAAHAIHELAPTAVPVSVRDPAKHTLQ